MQQMHHFYIDQEIICRYRTARPVMQNELGREYRVFSYVLLDQAVHLYHLVDIGLDQSNSNSYKHRANRRNHLVIVASNIICIADIEGAIEERHSIRFIKSIRSIGERSTLVGKTVVISIQ
jgi:hypothetical protein